MTHSLAASTSDSLPNPSAESLDASCSTASRQAPASLVLEHAIAGGDVSHWQLLSRQLKPDPASYVREWLQLALDDAHLAYGLAAAPEHLPDDCWVIQGPDQPVQVSQIIAINAQQQPQRLLDAYPTVQSPYTIAAKINRMMCCPDGQQAILNLTLQDGSSMYAFDTLFRINQRFYQQDQIYQIALGGFAYALERVPATETLQVDDAAAIKHHRALNAILARHHGVAPEDLQAQIAAWQASSDDDRAPVTLDISHMVAYLYGDHMGQEDEAWFQGELIGHSQTRFMDQPLELLDVVLIREPDSPPVVVRLAYARPEQALPFAVGDYIRGNIWLQATIYSF